MYYLPLQRSITKGYISVAFHRMLPAPVTGLITATLMTICIVFWFIVMFPFVIMRLIPVSGVQRLASKICVTIATLWVGSNQRIYKLMHGNQGQITIEGEFPTNSSFLVLSNHAAWADILVLFNTLHRHAPFGRFFLKKELIWIPIVGVVCWAMDFPFMARHSREKLAKNPELANSDLETTRQACEVYKTQPVTVINFLEGTRFTPTKQQKQRSQYNHLLNPKYGGLSTTLNVMGEQFAGLVNVTIVYEPGKGNKTWAWLCGRQQDMVVNIKVEKIDPLMIQGNYREDPSFKQLFKTWVNTMWLAKDKQIGEIKTRWNTSKKA